MKNSSFSLIAGALLLGACTKPMAKTGGPVLKTQHDSLSYGIGTRIGTDTRERLHESQLDSLDKELLNAGIRAGLDSAVGDLKPKLEATLRTYFTKKREEALAKQNAEAEKNLQEANAWLTENGKKPGVMTTASGLQYEVITMGKGPKPTLEDVVEVNYRGTLTNGTPFDDSYRNGQPIKFPVKNGGIQGWSEALQLMPIGSKWKVYIPPGLAYGAQGGGPIPPNSVLVFEMEPVRILPKEKK